MDRDPATVAGVPVDPSQRPGGGSITLVGTAHVSQASVDEVHETVDRERPDVVAVELDEGRFRQLQGGTPDDIEPKDLLSGNTVFQFLAYWMLSYVQSRLGEQFDVEPGADMRAGIEAAERNRAGLALVDRDIQVTMQRFWKRLTFGEKVQLIGGLALGITNPRTIGVTFGAAIGVFIGVVFAAFAASWVGLEGLLTLGITDPGLLQYIGVLGLGLVGGVFVGLLFMPSLEDVGGGVTNSLSFRLGAGCVVVIAAAAAVVATETFVGPITPDLFESAGTLSVRGLVGVVGGLAIGATLGAVVGVLVDSVTADVEDVQEIDIDQLTDGDVVSAMMEEFRRFSPRGAEALIDERDAYIAHKLHALRESGYYVVAVVGAGHRAGIERYLANPETLPEMETITGTASRRRFSVGKAIGYAIMVGFVGFFFLLVMGGVQNVILLQLFAAWVVINGLFAFTLARLAGARLSSAGVGGAVAWLTSVNPLLAPGWFAGYVELKHRPVNVTDIQTLNDLMDDTERPLGELVGEMFDVPLFRLIMIVAFTNVGSMIGTVLFSVVVLPWFSAEIGGASELIGELLQGAWNTLDVIREILS